LIKPEKLLAFSGQKRWIFPPGIGSPGKAKNNGIQEVVGSIPIGSTKQIKKSPVRAFFNFGALRGTVKIPLSLAPDHFFGMASGSLSNLDATQHARYLFDSFAFLELVNRR
jgi:hypothetical protein